MRVFVEKAPIIKIISKKPIEPSLEESKFKIQEAKSAKA